MKGFGSLQRKIRFITGSCSYQREHKFKENKKEDVCKAHVYPNELELSVRCLFVCKIVKQKIQIRIFGAFPSLLQSIKRSVEMAPVNNSKIFEQNKFRM